MGCRVEQVDVGDAVAGVSLARRITPHDHHVLCAGKYDRGSAEQVAGSRERVIDEVMLPRHRIPHVVVHVCSDAIVVWIGAERQHFTVRRQCRVNADQRPSQE